MTAQGVSYGNEPVQTIDMERSYSCKDGWLWVLWIHFFKGSPVCLGQYRSFDEAVLKIQSLDRIEART